MTTVHRVKEGFMSSRVHEFIPKPIRCYKCQRYGHVATSCGSTLRCSRCGESHEDECRAQDLRCLAGETTLLHIKVIFAGETTLLHIKVIFAGETTLLHIKVVPNLSRRNRFRKLKLEKKCRILRQY